MGNKLLIGALLACVALPAYSADMPVYKAAAPNPFQYPTGSGWYVGIGTEGGGGSANVSVPGLNSAALVTNQIGVHGLVGYSWAVPKTSMFAALEASGGYQNFNGATAGFSFTGPATFKQRFLFGAPTDLLMSVFPNIFSGLTPPPFPVPTGQTVSSTKGYIAFTMDEADISLNQGLAANKEWLVSPGVGVGILNLLSGGTAIDAHAQVRFDDHGFCVGPSGNGCAHIGTTFLAGFDLKWGI